MKIHLSTFLGLDPKVYELLIMMNKELTNMEIIKFQKDHIQYKWNNKILNLTRPASTTDLDYIEINIANLTDRQNLTISANLESKLPPVPSELQPFVSPIQVLTIKRKEEKLKHQNNGTRISSEEHSCSFIYNSLTDSYNYLENSTKYTDDFYDYQVSQIVIQENKIEQILRNPLQTYKQTISDCAIVPDHQFQFEVFMSFLMEDILPITVNMTDCPTYNYEIPKPTPEEGPCYMTKIIEYSYFDLGYQSYLDKIKTHLPSKKHILNPTDKKFYHYF